MKKKEIISRVLNVTCKMKVAIYQAEKGDALEVMEKKILSFIDNSKNESCSVLSLQVDEIMSDVQEDIEDFPSENMKELYAELNEDAIKAKYIKYSPDKLVRGQFGKFGKLGSTRPIEYVLLSDRFLDKEPLEGYFYLLSEPTLCCGGFWRETGERQDGYKVLEIEDIDEAKALERYDQFLSVWKE